MYLHFLLARISYNALPHTDSMKGAATTFVATIFSTGFFSFTESDIGNLHVNGDIWKLVVVSLTSTLLTVVVWVYLNKYGVPKYSRRDASQDKSQFKSSPRQIVGPPVILLDLPQEPGHRAQERMRNSNQSSDSQAQVHRQEEEANIETGQNEGVAASHGPTTQARSEEEVNGRNAELMNEMQL